jgi:hypothetical protein
MKARIVHALTGITLLLAPALAVHAADMYTPPLPANFSQNLGCVIVNVSGSPQVVTTEAFNSTGASSSGPLTETLAPGAAGGFALPGYYASYYCKFTVSGATKGFRASIEVSETAPPPDGFVIKVSLPAT